jgi:hypothetical protein
MSILKQVLSEALSSAFRKSPVSKSPGPETGARKINEGGQSSAAPATSPGSGMKAVILNWKAGENDPFTVINATLRQHFWACGKNVEVIEITERDWVARLCQLAPAGVEFALTWQGLGSSATFGEDGPSLWDHLKIPLICLHGDHPSHMPKNHQLESRYCFHLYNNAEFARYSNRHFRRAHSAGVIGIPRLHSESRLARRTGDYFVFAKNINDPVDAETRWQQQLPKPVFDSYMIAAETLKSLVTRGPYVDIHDVLDELIVQHDWQHLRPEVHTIQYHNYHSVLDHYLRSYKSVAVVSALREFPVRIYGRGWDRVAHRAPASHVFEPGRNMADSQDLYYTRFGLVDVSASKTLHDRTRRAMVNGCGFLSSANLEDSFSDIGRFDSLFFSLRPNELPEKCSAVVRHPDEHHALAEQFANLYHDTFHFRHFVNRIEQLAMLANTF